MRLVVSMEGHAVVTAPSSNAVVRHTPDSCLCHYQAFR